MMKIKKLLLNKIKKGLHFLMLMLFTCLSHADLPPAPDNSDISSGNWIKGIWDIISQVISVAIPVLTAVAIIGYGYALIAKFLEAKRQKEWGEFGLVAVIGAGIVVIVIILGNVGMQYFGGSLS